MPRMAAGLLICAFCVLAPGCASIYDEVDECLMNKRNECSAFFAWRAHNKYWDCEPFKRDFGRGFKDGYFDTLNGGGECPPTLPPRCYWSIHNSGPNSKQRTVSWYNGYAAGSMAAVSEGVKNRNSIVTASQIYKRCEPAFEWPEGEKPQSMDHLGGTDDLLVPPSIPESREELPLSPVPAITP